MLSLSLSLFACSVAKLILLGGRIRHKNIEKFPPILTLLIFFPFYTFTEVDNIESRKLYHYPLILLSASCRILTVY